MPPHALAALLFGAVAAAPSASRPGSPEPSVTPSPGTPVIFFLVDNSASLPPLDPQEKRVAALEKMFTFLRGQPYRLILFGGRDEVYVDDVQRYPPRTEFRLILLTDAILDPNPEDWADMGVPPGADLRAHVASKKLDML